MIELVKSDRIEEVNSPVFAVSRDRFLKDNGETFVYYQVHGKTGVNVVLYRQGEIGREIAFQKQIRTNVRTLDGEQPQAVVQTVGAFVEEGETIEECIIREAQEEAGLLLGDVQIIGDPKKLSTLDSGKTYSACAEVKGYTDERNLDPEEEISGTIWIPEEEIYDHLKNLEEYFKCSIDGASYFAIMMYFVHKKAV